MTTNWELQNAQKQIQQLRERNGIQNQSLLLSSASDSSWLETLRQPTGGTDTPPSSLTEDTPLAAVVTQEPPQPPLFVSVFKDEMEHHGEIAIAAMRAGYSSHYQLWLLLHLMDRPGSGRLDLDKVKLHLTELISKHHTWEWARVRTLLQEGDGRFWHLTGDRVYYTTHARLAAALGIEKLNGRFTTIQAEHVKGTSAATFRAHCFAAWMANHTNPISRRTIARLTGITPRSQRRYCKLVGIEQQANICIGPKATQEQKQECAWRYSGTFTFKDYHGKQGSRPGAEYVAWHLPSAYDSTATTGTRSRQRRANKQIDNLVNTGVRGNVDMFAREPLFFKNGAHAAKAVNRGQETDAYWPTKKARTGTGLWHVIR